MARRGIDSPSLVPPPPYRSIPDLFLARVAATPDAPALSPSRRKGVWKTPVVAARRPRVCASSRAGSASRHLRRRPGGHRVVHAPRVDPRGPRRRVRRRRHGDRLPRLDGGTTRPTSCPTRAAAIAFAEDAGTGPPDPEPPRRPSPSSATWSCSTRRRAFRATRCRFPTSPLSAAIGTRRTPAASMRAAGRRGTVRSRDADLHLRHHRPPEGRRADARLLALRRRGDRAR